MAQEKKPFTLHDLIPGGETYRQCTPQNAWYTWWGDQCVELDVDTLTVLKPGSKKPGTVLMELDQVNRWLEAAGKQPVHSLQSVSFPYADKPQVLFHISREYLLLDWQTGSVVWSLPIAEKAANMDWHKSSRNLAYTVDNNLWVMVADGKAVQVTNEPAGIKCGQVVHRNEFGIEKGTFWSPDGQLLAFYRMDETMVSDYPQVDTETRTAEYVPDKYPMAGTASHKVTVGVYDIATGKTIYLQAGDPTDRYFSNIAWSPCGKYVYMMEHPREQNRAELVRYHALTGEKDAVLITETHDKYVEPQHPITFLPWDDTKFIYHSQKDGFNHLYLYDVEGKELAQLTKGEWLVQEVVGFHEKRKEVIIVSTEVSPLQSNLYAVNVKNGKRRSIGNSEGVHTVQLSASADWMIDRYFSNIAWSPCGKYVYMMEHPREQNRAELVRYHALTGEKDAVLITETHEKYVEPQHPITFLPWDDTKFIYHSQKDGFNHLYLYDVEGKELAQLTKGEWLVQEVVGFHEKRKEVIIVSTEVSPLQSNLYAVSVKSGKRRPIGNSEGVHTVQLSASADWMIDRYSAPTTPRRIELVSVKDGKSRNVLLDAPNPWAGFNVPEMTVGTLKAADGMTDLYYRLVKPVNFDPEKKYPAVIYVYGGPHAQMIQNSWNCSVRGWDIYMAQQGYVVFTVDNRGSSNRGLAFENCTFRQLGVEEMKDQLRGVEFLKSLPYVDADRLGVHGWSYGGFMTTNLMLTYPDVFKVGVAGGPVTDWKYYEVMYGERYMDTPQTNPEGYKNSSLLEKAGNLKGRLLVIHGGNDPVCVPQMTYSFMKACIDKGTHPDLFIYPGHEHNMVGRDRVHLHEHITRYFEDFLK